MNEEIIYVRELTIEQKDLLNGKIWGYTGDGDPVYFNAIQDANDKWILSEQEVIGCTLQQALEIGCESWLLNLPKIEYIPKVIDQ